AAKKAEQWLCLLFDGFCRDPDMMPAYYRKLIASEGLKRTVCDYIAGMTDRYCILMLEKVGPAGAI
ncbi:MAG TPA: hypothetical protein VLH60_02500, partial [Sedimentisphaerales bacterium]|nr:hypothetical protein [Sedimentisphaerales bacterium]